MCYLICYIVGVSLRATVQIKMCHYYSRMSIYSSTLTKVATKMVVEAMLSNRFFFLIFHRFSNLTVVVPEHSSVLSMLLVRLKKTQFYLYLNEAITLFLLFQSPDHQKKQQMNFFSQIKKKQLKHTIHSKRDKQSKIYIKHNKQIDC